MSLLVMFDMWIGGGLLIGWLAGSIWKQPRPIGLRGDLILSAVLALVTGLTDWFMLPLIGLTGAQAQQGMAQAQFDELKAGARPEQLKAAQATVDAAAALITSAQANLKMLQLHRNQLTLTAPANGAILVRTIQPGEVALPGAALLTIGQIDSLSIVVYVPESQYGHITLGQTTQVKVDSFPGETFTASVNQIADQAEFTPRTVRTAEERATTVYAVKLALDNAGGRLKPGMPADVTWSE